MPARFITPPLPIWGLPLNVVGGQGTAEQLLLECYNNSGAVRTNGDFVSVDSGVVNMPASPSGMGGAVVLPVAANDPKSLGPISTGDQQPTTVTYAAGATVLVAIAGAARTNCSGGAVAAGNAIGTLNGVPGVTGTAFPMALPNIGSMSGVALEARDAANYARCLIYKF